MQLYRFVLEIKKKMKAMETELWQSAKILNKSDRMPFLVQKIKVVLEADRKRTLLNKFGADK